MHTHRQSVMKQHPVWPGRCKLFAVLLMGAGLTLLAAAKEMVLKTEANVMVELTLRAQQSYADPFNEVTLDVTFIDPTGARTASAGLLGRGRTSGRCATRRRCQGHTLSAANARMRATRACHGVTGKVEVRPYTRRRTRSTSTARCTWLPEPPLPGARRPHALLLAGRHLVDGPLPPAALAGGISAARCRP